jgi:two-component system phosphate regulon response regulator PhoB
MQGSILVVEHDAPTRELLAGNLRSAGYQVTRARDLQEAESLIHKVRPDLALLGCAPGTPGLMFARQLRSDRRTVRTCIIMMSARPGEEGTVAALECGADDCLDRSVSMRELLARVKAVLRRRAPERTDETIEFAGLRVDPALHRVTSGDREIELPRTDFKLLLYFVTHAGWTLSRRQLLDEIWGDDVYVEERTVDVHVRRLRRALPPEHGDFIETVRGLGYRWRTGPEPSPVPALHTAVSRFVARVQEYSEAPLASQFGVA